VKPRVSLRKALADKNLLGNSLPGPSWLTWHILLVAAMGEPLTEYERPIYTTLTGGREREPLERAEELVCAIGRRGGKTEAVATLGAYLAGCIDYSDVLVPGEVGVMMIVASDQEQAGIVLDRVEAKLRTSPIMSQLLKSRTARHLRLTNGITIQVRSSDYRKVRGTTMIAGIGDECAFWSTDEGSANPDTAICAAMRPALDNGRLAGTDFESLREARRIVFALQETFRS
jgi:phage terminase large subunit-like protein